MAAHPASPGRLAPRNIPENLIQPMSSIHAAPNSLEGVDPTDSLPDEGESTPGSAPGPRAGRRRALGAGALVAAVSLALLPWLADLSPALGVLAFSIAAGTCVAILPLHSAANRRARELDVRLRVSRDWALRLVDLEIDFNPSTLEILRASSREPRPFDLETARLPGLNLASLLPLGEADPQIARLGRQEFLAPAGSFTLRFQDSSGEVRVAEAHAAPGYETGVRRVGLVDVTERFLRERENEERAMAVEFANQYITELNRELESSGKELESARQRLFELNESKSRFVAMAAHELRTPMTAAKTAVSVLQAGMLGPVSEQQAEVLGIIHQNVDRLVRLVNDLLDLARIEAGKVELECREFDVTGVLRHAAELMHAEASRRSIGITVEASPLFWSADSDRVLQVVLNILGNAVKFTPEGGSVTLDAVEIDAGLRVEVRDSGQGIAPDELPLLFKPFERLSNEATRKANGTGLGLSISRELVELHGGRIWPESVVGQGTSIFFILPRPAESAAQAA